MCEIKHNSDFFPFELPSERPPGSPVCSVLSVNNDSLLYECDWMGGTPQATLSFPALNNASRGEGHFRLILPASTNLNGKTVSCQADHPVQQNTCNITACRLFSFSF